ncbi:MULTISPECIES: type III secretion system export apparatus subunit SctS [unclassified Caballeronia]|uniref:type III secretion system export apparatus subunit SctS n=1 Tax=unclassified Caballeronia TaxID=2646786 RepID=UPI00285B17F9|nr:MULTISPECIES: type III secretion system export apparatus subunit SctS [unclassified Caballeronia]MDR5760152.1 type III secretion system export apparatus subunit SctS [Caballeronia sp. LZ035]MDR5816457.1 type III secretion system export apparatus subunit SctS [Caballeronia sp. LZ033]MDR5823128.1 type III secretion system export apparatus subunit SctS [Caballeronia sp. LZ043]MDR5836716.1 type III secretion system export apparatus subunit SctS [Caballeronia sp. LZ034LL]MDR5881256.1 type III se
MNPLPSLASLSGDALLLVFWLSLPMLAVATAVGLLLGLVQSVTQIQDQSLPYGAKIICVGLVLIVAAPWAHHEIARLLGHVFSMIAAGRTR